MVSKHGSTGTKFEHALVGALPRPNVIRDGIFIFREEARPQVRESRAQLLQAIGVENGSSHFFLDQSGRSMIYFGRFVKSLSGVVALPVCRRLARSDKLEFPSRNHNVRFSSFIQNVQIKSNNTL